MTAAADRSVTDRSVADRSVPNRVVALGLGSNLGNRLQNLRAAVSALRNSNLRNSKSGNSDLKNLNLGNLKVEITRMSDVFETAPWGVTDQPRFLNACLLAAGPPEPEEWLALLKDVEARMGRTVTRRWGERVIDIDLLAMGTLVYDSPALRVPHADMHRRLFVLTPLAQILPGWVHPVTSRTVAEMAAALYETEPEKPLRICSL